MMALRMHCERVLTGLVFEGCAYVWSSVLVVVRFFFFSSRRRHTRFDCDWSSDVCSSDLMRSPIFPVLLRGPAPMVGAVYTLRLRSRHRPCDSPRRGLHHAISHGLGIRKPWRCRYANRTEVRKPRTGPDGRGV